MVEFIRWIFKLEKKLRPTEILKALNPWLPKPGIISKDEGKEETEDNPDQGDPSWWLGVQEKTLSGIVQGIVGGTKDRSWTEIFNKLTHQEYDYLGDKEGHLRRNRAISLVVAVGLAFLTGINTFHILLGPEVQEELDYFWYTVGGILLSAFAATAGASVWHDLLDKLRQGKEETSQPEEG